MWNTSIMEWNKENTVQEKHLQSCFCLSLIVLKNWKFQVIYGCQNTENSEFVLSRIQEIVLNNNRGLFWKTELQVASLQHLKTNVKRELRTSGNINSSRMSHRQIKEKKKITAYKFPESNVAEMAKTSAGTIWRQIISDRNMVMALHSKAEADLTQFT